MSIFAATYKVGFLKGNMLKISAKSMDSKRTGTNKILHLIVCIFLFSIANLVAVDANAADGAAVFKANCASCHKLTDQKLSGPGLKGVADRVPQPAKEWLLKWVKNNTEVIASGNPYAVKLYNEYNKAAMTVFEYLSDEELNAVVDYIIAPPAAPAPATPADGAPVADKGKPAEKDNTLNFVLIALTAIFLVLVVFLGQIRNNLEKIVAEKEGRPIPVTYEGWAGVKLWMSHNKKIVALGGFIGVLWVLKLGWDGLMGIGVYKDYQPEQPIKFSHELHAGVNKVNCVYCHSGAERSKHAGIPSANVCMNCHKAIQEGPKYGKTEIAKIYAALDYNPETQTYGTNPKPIKWIKIHNLPDHAYFNHQQHVNVGKVECKTCHGAVDSMEVVKQHTELTMGWCINCHRETQVQMDGNAYYADIRERFDKHAKEHKGVTLDKMDKVTVETMGGTECGKCHH